MNQVASSRLKQTWLWRNDPRIYRWCRQASPVSWNHHSRYWERIDRDPNSKMYHLDVKGQHVGVFGLTSIDWINRRAEVSLYIDPDQHLKGLGYKGAKVLMRQAFKVLNLNCIWGEAFDGSPAIGLFKKCGFKEEGRRRQFYYRDGKYVDAILFSLTRGEYVA